MEKIKEFELKIYELEKNQIIYNTLKLARIAEKLCHYFVNNAKVEDCP